jgi:hypothetical protein
MYDAIREKVGNATLPGTNLAVAARAALSKISGTSITPTVFRDILSKYPEEDPEFIVDPTKGINSLGKVGKDSPYYELLKERFGGGATAPPVTFADLQGYYSELGKELSRGNLPGDVYQATRALQDSIGDMKQKMANAAGVGPQHIAATKFYREYMDTFHEPAGPSSSGSPVAQALLAKDPAIAVDKFAGDSGDRGIAILRRYSNSLANLAQDVQRTARTKISVPESKSVMDVPQPKSKPVPTGANLPLPPVLPEMEQVPFREPKLTPSRTISADDLRRANEEAVRTGAEKLTGRLFWWTGIWPAFRMLSELTRGQDVSLRPLALMPASGAVGMATEELLSHPAVMEFFTRPTRQQIAAIPPELRGDMPRIVATAKARGIQVGPLLAAYAASVQQQRQQGTTQPPVSVAQALQAMQGATQ